MFDKVNVKPPIHGKPDGPSKLDLYLWVHMIITHKNKPNLKWPISIIESLLMFSHSSDSQDNYVTIFTKGEKKNKRTKCPS